MRTRYSFPLLLSALLLLAFAASLPVLAQNIRKGPYLIYPGVNTQMNILWQDDMTSTDQVRWGTDPSMLSGPVSSVEYGTDHQHLYTIGNLIPGIKYYYQVMVGSVAHNGTFTAAPATNASSLKFFAYGDTRTNIIYHDEVAQQVNATYTADPGYQTFILSMGDLVYNGNDEARWTSEFFNYSYPNLTGMLQNLPYESAIGNHELSSGQTLFPKYFPYPFAGGRYYSFDYGPAHFTVVDQYVTYTAGSTQYNWIVNDLAASSKPWKFMIFHEPGWSAGGGHANNTTVQTVLEPLCDQYNVAIVFAGHNHYYARAEVPASGGRIIHHVTAGAAGAPLYTPDPGYPYIVASASAYHFCKISIVNEYLLEFEARTSTGALIDNFTIDRTPTPPPVVTRYSPVSTTIRQGSLNSGTVADLATNNGVYYSVNSTTGKPRVCDWYGSFSIAEAPSSVTTLTVTYDGKYTRAINQYLYLYNFSTGSWVQTDNRTVSVKDVTVTYVQNSPGSFISSAGEIRLRVNGSSTSKNFTCFGDYMAVTVESPGNSRTSGRTAPVESRDLPAASELLVYPNPAGAHITVEYRLDHPSAIRISIYSIMGEQVGSLVSAQKKEAGTIEAFCDISDLPSGIYLVTLTATDEAGQTVRRARKLVIAR